MLFLFFVLLLRINKLLLLKIILVINLFRALYYKLRSRGPGVRLAWASGHRLRAEGSGLRGATRLASRSLQNGLGFRGLGFRVLGF